MKTLGIIVVVAVTISFGMSTNVFGQGQQNVTRIIMDQTSNIPQCSLAEQARGLGLNTSQFSLNSMHVFKSYMKVQTELF